uniref:Uncharacterized protein n=1 Tax=Romanomermis culicivorax TaxID=13658 RepID=A0A915I446_ROMCU
MSLKIRSKGQNKNGNIAKKRDADQSIGDVLPGPIKFVMNRIAAERLVPFGANETIKIVARIDRVIQSFLQIFRRRHPSFRVVEVTTNLTRKKQGKK